MNYELSFREKHNLSESDLTDAQRTLHFIAENMRMRKSISEDGYKHFQQAIKALGQESCEDSKAFEWNEIRLSPPDVTGRKWLVGFPPKDTPVLTTDSYGNTRMLCYCDEYDHSDVEDGPYWYDPDTEDCVCPCDEIEYWMYIELPQDIKARKEQTETPNLFQQSGH